MLLRSSREGIIRVLWTAWRHRVQTGARNTAPGPALSAAPGSELTAGQQQGRWGWGADFMWAWWASQDPNTTTGLFPKVVYEIHRNGLCSSWKQSHFHGDPGPGTPGAVPPLHGAAAEAAGPAHCPQERYGLVPRAERSQLSCQGHKLPNSLDTPRPASSWLPFSPVKEGLSDHLLLGTRVTVTCSQNSAAKGHEGGLIPLQTLLGCRALADLARVWWGWGRGCQPTPSWLWAAGRELCTGLCAEVTVWGPLLCRCGDPAV